MWYFPPHCQLMPGLAHFSPPLSRLYESCTQLLLRNARLGEEPLPQTGIRTFDKAPPVMQQYAVCTSVIGILNEAAMPRRLTSLLDAAAGVPFHFIARSKASFDRNPVTTGLAELHFDTRPVSDPASEDFERYWKHCLQPAIDLVSWGCLPSTNRQLAAVSVEASNFRQLPPMPLDTNLTALSDILEETVEASL